MPQSGERWIFTVELPSNVSNGGRFTGRLLKHLLRAWGCKCTAILDAPPEPPSPPAEEDNAPTQD